MSAGNAMPLALVEMRVEAVRERAMNLLGTLNVLADRLQSSAPLGEDEVSSVRHTVMAAAQLVEALAGELEELYTKPEPTPVESEILGLTNEGGVQS